MPANPQQRRAARHAQSVTNSDDQPTQKLPITVERIISAAQQVIEDSGYDALTMRSVASLLDTGPASLYAHVVNKEDLGELIIGRLCSQVELPVPDPGLWRQQIFDVCSQLREQYLKYPGVSRAALAMVVTNLDVLRVQEGMLDILITGGIRPQKAAWAIDALVLYVGAYTLEISLVSQRQGNKGDEWMVNPEDRDELVNRFEALPKEQFPQTKRFAKELTSGTGNERFDFAVNLIIGNLD